MKQQSSIKRTKLLANIAILVAMEIVLNRLLSINTQIVKIGFSWLPIAIAGALYGPLWGGTAWALADFIGAVLLGGGLGPYFPGFTLTCFLGGAIFGLFFHRRPVTIVKIIIAVLIWALLSLGLNSIWICVMYGRSIWAILPVRLVQTAIHVPIQIICIWTLTAERSPVGRALLRIA